MLNLQVAYQSGCDQKTITNAFLFGANFGIAFQLVDDLLDYTASTPTIGKPVATDLQLGLATAPVLFACQQVS